MGLGRRGVSSVGGGGWTPCEDGLGFSSDPMMTEESREWIEEMK